MLLALSLASAAEPTLDVRIALTPAEAAVIQVPARMGSVTERVVSGVPMDVTVTVTELEGQLYVSAAAMPASKRVRGVDEGAKERVSSLVQNTGWPAVLANPLPIPQGGSVEVFYGGDVPLADGTLAPQGIVLNVSRS
ncbi:MAG: hypothetical protein R3F61_06865 [Myxococcota bacterium]